MLLGLKRLARRFFWTKFFKASGITRRQERRHQKKLGQTATTSPCGIGELLEDRTLLATYNVTRLGDFGAGATIGDFSRGDLRFASTTPTPIQVKISSSSK
jgi:hypothetical protein